MRRLWACLAALALMGSAAAQEPLRDDGLGPFRFGMSIEEARSAAPNAAWRAEDVEGATALTGGPRIVLGGARFSSILMFQDAALKVIALTASSETECAQVIPSLLAQLEPSFGSFGAAPGSGETGTLVSVTRTPGGSEIRGAQGGENGPISLYSSHRSAMFIHVAGHPQTDAQGCRISITLNAQLPYAGTAALVTYSELDQASSVVAPIFIEQPDAQDFVRSMPRLAVERGRSASIVLDCVVASTGRLRCLVVNEAPEGVGFGEAAMEVMEQFRTLQARDGSSTIGKRIRRTIVYHLGRI